VNSNTFFAPEGHIIRRIWGKSDTILLIFAGSAAEFALNKAVDWLYFTGKIPKDPIGRLFSTVSYARMIIFASEAEASQTINAINNIHAGVEKARGNQIPQWAFRDVLYMLIHYSIAAFELLERRLTQAEKEATYANFLKLGLLMQINDLPAGYEEWRISYLQHQARDLAYSPHTADLFKQYKKHLGAFRYRILLESQKMVLPEIPARLLQLDKRSAIKPLLPFYKLLRATRTEWLLKNMLLPKKYLQQIRGLDHH
jgi:ER-bound oxygenase mpaB/B'/Rubber oxygenase, catalytic domain